MRRKSKLRLGIMVLVQARMIVAQVKTIVAQANQTPVYTRHGNLNLSPFPVLVQPDFLAFNDPPYSSLYTLPTLRPNSLIISPSIYQSQTNLPTTSLHQYHNGTPRPFLERSRHYDRWCRFRSWRCNRWRR